MSTDEDAGHRPGWGLLEMPVQLGKVCNELWVPALVEMFVRCCTFPPTRSSERESLCDCGQSAVLQWGRKSRRAGALTLPQSDTSYKKRTSFMSCL